MISYTGYYAPEVVAERLKKARARAHKLEALMSSIATQKKEAARTRHRRRHRRYREVIQLRARGLNWTQIGQKMGVTRQGARFIYDQFQRHTTTLPTTV